MIADRCCSNCIFILDLTPGFNRLIKDNCNTRRETFRCWDLVRLIFEAWRCIGNTTFVPYVSRLNTLQHNTDLQISTDLKNHTVSYLDGIRTILRIISRSVSGLATDSPCGVWGRGWTTCLLHDSPLFGSHFKMRVGMYVWSDISYMYYFLPLFTVSRTKPVIFLRCNNLFIYQVLCTLIYRRRSLYSFLSYRLHASWYPAWCL